MKAITALMLLAFAALLQSPAVGAGEYATPEDAVAGYMAAVSAHRLDKIIAASAVEDMATHLDFVAYVDRLNSLTPAMPAPATDPMLVAIDRAYYTSQIARQVQFLTYGLMAPVDITDGTIVQMDGAGAADFAKAVDPQRLSELKVIKIAMPMASMATNARYISNNLKQAKTAGADELAERVALLQFDDKTYLLGFTLLRFGKNWGVSSQSSALANTSFMGAAKPVTPEGFEALLR